MDVISLFTTLFGIVGFAGGAVGYFAKGRGDSIIAYQEKQIKLLQDDNARLEKSVVSLEAERDGLNRENKTLQRLAQGSPQLAKLTSEIKGLVDYLKQDREGKK